MLSVLRMCGSLNWSPIDCMAWGLKLETALKQRLQRLER